MPPCSTVNKAAIIRGLLIWETQSSHLALQGTNSTLGEQRGASSTSSREGGLISGSGYTASV